MSCHGVNAFVASFDIYSESCVMSSSGGMLTVTSLFFFDGASHSLCPGEFSRLSLC